MKNIITRRRFNIVCMFTIVVLLANLLIANFVNKSLASRIPDKYDLRAEIGQISYNNMEQNSINNAAIIQLKSHIELGKKNGKYASYNDEVVNNIDKLEQDLNYKVKGIFPLYKETTSNGVKYYKDTDGSEASSNDLNEHREALKHIIMNNGGIVAYVSKNGVRDGLNNTGKVCLSKELTTAMGDLAVVIIGWDDSFTKDNFSEDCRPTSNGAFLVQSYDETFYVSYEDIYIENNLRYIDSVEEYKAKEELGKSDVTDNQDRSEDVAKPDESPKQEEPAKSEELPDEIKQVVPTETKKDDNQAVEPSQGMVPEKSENFEEPKIKEQTSKVETGSDALEVDTSSINNNDYNNDSSDEKNINVPKVVETTNVEYADTKNVAKGKLPQTGSNTELILIISIAAVMFMAFIVHSLRNVIKIDKEMS